MAERKCIAIDGINAECIKYSPLLQINNAVTCVEGIIMIIPG